MKYRVNEKFFEKWSQNSAYVLGFIFADGHLENSPYIRGKYLRITSTDFSIVDRIKKTLDASHTIVETPPCGNRKRKYMLRIGSHKIYNDLETLRLHPRKSLDMQFPDVPSHVLADFIRGYFDGDGTITIESLKHSPHNRLKVIFTSGSKDFLSSLATKLKNECIDKLGRVINSNRSYQLIYRSRDALKVLDFIYGPTAKKDTLSLERKHKRYRLLKLDPNRLKCGNLFDKKSRLWAYGMKMATYPSG